MSNRPDHPGAARSRSSRLFRRRAVELAACLAGLVQALSAGPALAQSDSVRLRNGRVIEGAIVSRTAAEVVVRTNVGEVRLARRDIAEINESVGKEAEEVQAERFAAQGRFSDAIRLLERLQARAEGARNSATQKRVEEALATLRKRLAEQVERELSVKLATAREARRRGNLDQALDLARSARATMTGEDARQATNRFVSEIHLERAARAADRQDVASRRKELDLAVETDPTNYTAQIALGRLLLESAAEEAAGIERIEAAIAKGGKSIPDAERARLHYLLGERHFRRKQYQDAATNFVAVLAIKDAPRELANALDRAVECYVNLGETSMSTGSEKTLEGLTEALNLNPTNTKALFLMGQILYQLGQYSDAIVNLRKLLAIDGRYPQANALLAKSALALKDFDTAIASFDRELELNPNNYETLCDRADLRMLIADYSGARQDIERAKLQQTDGIRAFLLEAQLNIIDERLDEAQRSLQSLISRATTVRDKLEPYLQMGRVLARKKETDNARQWFQTVGDFLLAEAKTVGTTSILPLRYRNILAEVNVELGRLNLEQDNPRSAENNFREALTIASDFPAALIGIGDVRRRLGDETALQADKDALYREAEDSYKKALAINQRDADSVLKLAILYHRFMKDTARARAEYRRYIEMGGRDKATAQQGLDEIGQEETTSPADEQTSPSDTATTPTATAA